MKEKIFEIPTEVLQVVTSELAYEYRIVPFNVEENSYDFYTDASDVLSLEEELAVVLGKRVHVRKEETAVMDQLLQRNYRKRVSKGATTLQYSDDFLLSMIHEAKEIGSSDIHFEAFEHQKRVRFRIDGKLIEKKIKHSHESP